MKLKTKRNFIIKFIESNHTKESPLVDFRLRIHFLGYIVHHVDTFIKF